MTGIPSQNFMPGEAARLNAIPAKDLIRMKKSGIGWLRVPDFAFDQKTFFLGKPSESRII